MNPSRFTEYINDCITAYTERRLGDAFNDLTDASIELEKETLEQLKTSQIPDEPLTH